MVREKDKKNTASKQRKPAPKKSAPVRVLVVDDEKVIRGLFKRVLEVRDHSVTTVESGKEAIKIL